MAHASKELNLITSLSWEGFASIQHVFKNDLPPGLKMSELLSDTG